MSESSETRSDLEQTLAQLENLADVGNVAEISVEMPQLRVAAQRSLNAARNADLAVAAQRRFVSAMVESLESIGCHVQPLVPAPSGAAALSAETADGDRLDGRVGADGKVHLRFVHLADGMDRAQEQREARRRGAEWCERRPQLVAQLEARGMTLSAEWSIEPDDEAVAVVEHSRDVDGVRRRPASQSRKANQS